MKREHSAPEPKEKPCPIVCRTSDLEFDFGSPVRLDHRRPGDRWRAEHVEEEHGLRLDVYRAVGLL